VKSTAFPPTSHIPFQRVRCNSPRSANKLNKNCGFVLRISFQQPVNKVHFFCWSSPTTSLLASTDVLRRYLSSDIRGMCLLSLTKDTNLRAGGCTGASQSTDSATLWALGARHFEGGARLLVLVGAALLVGAVVLVGPALVIGAVVLFGAAVLFGAVVLLGAGLVFGAALMLGGLLTLGGLLILGGLLMLDGLLMLGALLLPGPSRTSRAGRTTVRVP
jgi:hypothetical protein